MKLQIKKNQINLIAISVFLFILAACSGKIDPNKSLATVNNKPILKDTFEKELSFYQKFYIKKYGEDYFDEKNKNGDSNLKRLESELLDSLIKDQILLDDLNKNKVTISKNDSQSLIDELIDKIGDEASLKANIDAFGSDENEFNEIIFRDAIRKKHRDYFLSKAKVGDSEVIKFFEDNTIYQVMYKYDVLIFDDKFEASKIKTEIKDEKDFRKFLEADIRNYGIIRSDFVYADDDILKEANVLEKNQISDIFKYKDSYVILMVNSLNKKKNDLLVSAKQIYLKNEYDKYIKNLIKNSNIKLFIR